MSVDYYSHAIIGCEVPVIKLYKKIIIKHTQHTWPDGSKFCPTCGKETETIKDEPIFNENDNTIGAFSLVWATDNRRAFVGLVAESDDEDIKMTNLPDIKKLESELESVLGPLGLWRADKFGLYSVLYCSY